MTLAPGPRNLITDVAGLRVGNAGDPALKSGVTVLTGDAPFVVGVHVAGGAPGTRETDLLAPDKMVGGVDALVLSGGSAFGLDAASGVADALAAMGRGFAVGPVRVPIVPAAILFDLLNGGQKDRETNPYRALGAAALAAAEADFAIGSHGAGLGATTADVKGGLGSASLVLNDGTTVGALVAVNAIGSPLVETSRHFWAAPFEMAGEFGGHGPHPAPDPSRLPALKGGPRNGANTTIAIVATDASLDKAGAHRMAIAAHDGIGRALVPAHTPHDGDLVFAVATGARQGADPLMLGHAVALCLARAIARGVYAADPAPGDPVPCYRKLIG